MDKKQLSERDICTKFTTPALERAGWDTLRHVREEVSFTDGRIIVRSQIHTRAPRRRADYVLYREAASAIIGAFVEKPNASLARLIGVLKDKPHEKEMAANSAMIINRLHPRRKASEQRYKGLRRITDEDAQFAVACLGNILVELEWGRR